MGPFCSSMMVRASMSPTGTMTFPVDTWLLERVEVLRGPASVLYGVGAIGGAINYVPRQPLRSIRLTDVLFSAERFDTYQLGVNTSGPISDRAAYQIGVIGTRSDGYVDDGDSRRVSTASSLVFDVTPDLTLLLAFDGAWNEPLRYFGTPLNAGAIDTRLRNQNYNVSDSLIRWEDYWVRLHADWRLGPAGTLHNERYYLTVQRHWRNVENYTFQPDTGQVDRTSYIEILHDQEQFRNRFDTLFDGWVLQRPYRVVVGFDVNRITFRSTSNSPFPGESTVDAFHPDSGVFLHDEPTRPRFDTRTTQFSLFTEGFFYLTKPLKLLAGLRWDYIDYTCENLISPDMSFDKTVDALTWRVGGVFDLMRALALYAQISSGTDPLGSLITLSLSESEFNLTRARQ
jgi:iron complex outermembrane recepter protein